MNPTNVPPPQKILLCGDVGGTNGRVQIWTTTNRPLGASSTYSLQKIFSKTYRVADYYNIQTLLANFLNDALVPFNAFYGLKLDRVRIDASAFGMRGVVWEDGRKNDPNGIFHADGTPWSVTAAEDVENMLQIEYGKFIFVNDFVAIGYGIAALANVSPELNLFRNTIAESVEMLHEGKPKKGAPIACLGAGTGLGVVFLTCPPDSTNYQVFPSEAGMASVFSPESELECRLKLYLQRCYGFVEVERIVSGPGLVSVYKFFLEEQPSSNPEVAKNIFAAELDIQPARISEHAKNGDPTCLAALDLMIDVYARMTSLIAVTFLPYAGLYIAGGIFPKISWRARAGRIPGIPDPGRFVTRFLEAGLMSEPVSRVPLYLITSIESGTFGSVYKSWDMTL